MSYETMASVRRRPFSPAPTAAPLEDDNLLAEILLRLPPQPSSLPRASAVSRRWRSLASDPHFSRRFRAHHHRKPPLLGYFGYKVRFQPILDAPNRVPRDRFSFPDGSDWFSTLGCRHGLVLSIPASQNQLLVWDPATGDQHRLDIPPGFDTVKYRIGAGVLRAAGDVHHFQVVLVGHFEGQDARVIASIYSSRTGVWGNHITLPLPPNDPTGFVPIRAYKGMPTVMVGDSLYWLFWKLPGIIEFDLVRQGLALVPMPVDETIGSDNMCVMPAEGGGLGFLFLTGFCAQLWKRRKDSNGVASWVLRRSVQLDKLLSLNPETEQYCPLIVGFAEYNNVVLLRTSIGFFTVQLESLQFKKLFVSDEDRYYFFYPYEVVYTAGI